MSKKFSHSDVAKHCDVTRSAVAQWETATEPSHANVAKLCDMLGISQSQFWGAVPKKAAGVK